MALDGESSVFGDKVLQIGPVDPLKQLFKGRCFEIGKHQQHPLAGAQADIRFCQRPLVAGEQHPAVLHPDIFNIQPAQFVAGNALQPEQGGDGKFKICHKTSIRAEFSSP